MTLILVNKNRRCPNCKLHFLMTPEETGAGSTWIISLHKEWDFKCTKCGAKYKVGVA